jgi:hypothetical protein
VGGPVQSVNIIGNLPLFSIAYYVWLFNILMLLFSKTSARVNHWEKITLVGLFAVVFWGFWTIHTPEGQSEEIAFLAYVKHLEETGHIGVATGNLTYFDFPGLSLFGYSISNLAGLNHVNTRTVIMLLNAALMGLLLYHLYRRLADSTEKPTGLYLLAVPLLVQSNMVLSIGFFFRPENALGLVLLMTLVVLAVARQEESSLFGCRRNRLLAIVVFAALVITHFLTAVAFIAILSGLYSVRLAIGRRRPPLSSIGLFAVMAAAWVLFHAVAFSTIVGLLPRFVSLLRDGGLFFYAYTVGVSNVGGSVPFWAGAVRVFWLAVYGAAGLLALLNLTRLRRLHCFERDYSGALVAIGIMGGMATLVGGVGDQASRYVQYGGFFAIPVVLAFISRAIPKGYIAVVLTFFMLSLPTFLAYHGRASIDAFYTSERSSAEFLRSHFTRTEEQFSIFTGPREQSFYIYHFPQSRFTSAPGGVRQRGDIQSAWLDINGLVAAFATGSSVGAQGDRVFIFSRAFPMTYEHLLGISPDDPRWLRVKAHLADGNPFYDNGHVRMYW